MAQTVNCLPTMWETQVWYLGWEDPLEKEMVTHFSILAWRIPWTEECGRLQSMGSQRVGHNWATSPSFCFFSVFMDSVSVITGHRWYYIILYKGLEHLWISVSEGGPRTNPLGIWMDDCTEKRHCILQEVIPKVKELCFAWLPISVFY